MSSVQDELKPTHTRCLMIYNLQELIRPIQRRDHTDEIDFVATLWSWWRQQPIPSQHPRIPEHELLRKYLRVRAEILHVPVKQFQALHTATYHVFAQSLVQETQVNKVSIRSDVLKQMFDFYDQISSTRQYRHLEQINQQARGIGNNINFWLACLTKQCWTLESSGSKSLMITFKSGCQFSMSIRQPLRGLLYNRHRSKIFSIRYLVPKILLLAQMGFHTRHGDYLPKIVTLSLNSSCKV